VKAEKSIYMKLFFEIIAITGLISSIILLQENIMLVFLAISFEAFILFLIYREINIFQDFLIISVFGTLAETVFVNNGVWVYSNSSFLGIPVWFPVAFGIAGILINGINTSIKEIIKGL
jgi:hypothetical protein